MTKKKVLILGSYGMLGKELARVFAADTQYEVAAWDRDDVDVTDFPELGRRLNVLQPAIVINAVAYNAVDRCEEDDAEYTKALVLNRDVPGFLAEQSRALGYLLVHYSTDYVFDGALEASSDGSSQVGYNEEAVSYPLSRYGESKLAGEQAVETRSGEYYLIRLSKLFGRPGTSAEAKKSFFAVMLEQSASKNEVRVVDDERSCFTYAPDLARATKELIESRAPFGIYHLPNEGAATWYEAAQELYRQANKNTRVVAITSAELKRPAQRPQSSALLNTKRPKLRKYQEALREFLSTLH